MLRKLYKHELYSLFKSLTPVYVALALFTVLCKLSDLLKINNTIFNILTTASKGFYIISIIALFIVGLVIIITRFYKNLLTHEGYLSFSLPFTATQHIVCKLLCGVLMMVVNFILILLSLVVIGLGTDALDEIINVFKIYIEQLKMAESTFNIVLAGLLILVILIVTLFQSTLMFYASMAIGQQFKNKIGGSVLAYVILYAGTESVSAVFAIPLMFFSQEAINDYLNSNLKSVIILLICVALLYIIYSLVYFLLARHFLTKKLNLE